MLVLTYSPFTYLFETFLTLKNAFKSIMLGKALN